MIKRLILRRWALLMAALHEWRMKRHDTLMERWLDRARRWRR